MVRLEERPWRAQATLLLDTRARAHLCPLPVVPADGRGRLPAPDTLEWLVEAAATIGTELARRGARCCARWPTSSSPRPAEAAQPRGPAGPAGRGRTSRVPGLAAGIEQLCRAAGDGPVICLLGAVGPDDVADLIRRRSGPTTDLAVLVDIESWADAGLVLGRRGPSTATRCADQAAQGRRHPAAGREQRVADARPDQSVADVWADLGTQAGPVAGLGRETIGAPT